jgi:hypothetical protein
MFAVPGGITGSDSFRSNDWLNTRFFDAAAVRSVLEHGQFPLRSHLVGGGFPTVAHPSDGSWSPTILLMLAFGDVAGVKLLIGLFALLGAWGVFGLARRELQCSSLASFGASALFVSSAWLPSMMAVGFYNQLFFLAAPGILHLSLSSPGYPHRLLLAGGLYALVLQQGLHAFPAIGFALFLYFWLRSAGLTGEGLGLWRTWSQPLLLLFLLTAPLALAKHLDPLACLACGWGFAALLVFRNSRTRSFVSDLLPWLRRLVVLTLVACSLGVARLVGLWAFRGQSKYEHSLSRSGARWFPGLDSPPVDEERFYSSLGGLVDGLVGAVPAEVEYAFLFGRPAHPLVSEYGWVGLSWVGLALAIAGVSLAILQARTRPLVIWTLLFVAVCMGWHIVPDVHFLLTWGVPFLEDFSQPIKYWNFFILLGSCLLAALSFQFVDTKISGWPRRLLLALMFVGLLCPLGQSRDVLREAFSRPVVADGLSQFHQTALVADAWWAELGPDQIKTMSNQLMLREKVRPRGATEYFNLLRGVGTVDWYGSYLLPEHAVPRYYVSLDGDQVLNPRYRGEAWLEQGAGVIDGLLIRPNTIHFDATLKESGRVVVNQNFLAGFQTSVGQLVEHEGLLAVDLPVGQHDVELLYRPRNLLLGLAASFLATLAWIAAILFFILGGNVALGRAPASYRWVRWLRGFALVCVGTSALCVVLALVSGGSGGPGLAKISLGLLASAELAESWVRRGGWIAGVGVWLGASAIVMIARKRLRSGGVGQSVLGLSLLLASVCLTSPAWLLHRSASAALLVAILLAVWMPARGTKPEFSEALEDRPPQARLWGGVLCSLLVASILVALLAILGMSWTIPGILSGPSSVRTVFAVGSERFAYLPLTIGLLVSIGLVIVTGSRGGGARGRAAGRVALALLPAFAAGHLLSLWWGEAGLGWNQLALIVTGAFLGLWIRGRSWEAPTLDRGLAAWLVFLALFPWGLGWDQLWACDRVIGQPGVVRLSARPDGFDLASDLHSRRLLVSHRDARLLASYDLSGQAPPTLIELADVIPLLGGGVSGHPAMLAPENVLSLGDGTFLAYSFLFRSSKHWSVGQPYHQSREALLGSGGGSSGRSDVLLLRIASSDGTLISAQTWSGCWPASLEFHAPSGLVLTTCEEVPELWVAPAADPLAAQALSLPADLRLEGLVPLGSAEDPRAWAVPLWEGHDLVELDLLSGEIRRSIPIGEFSWDVAGSEEGDRVFVPRFIAGTTLHLNARTGEVEGRMDLDLGMRAVEYDAEREILYAASTYSGRLGSWDISEGAGRARIAEPLRFGTMLRAIHLDGASRRLYAASDCGVFEVELADWLGDRFETR